MWHIQHSTFDLGLKQADEGASSYHGLLSEVKNIIDHPSQIGVPRHRGLTGFRRLEISRKLPAAEIRLLKTLALDRAAAEYFIELDRVPQKLPFRFNVGVQTITHILKRHGLALGAALVLGFVAVRPQGFRLGPAFGPPGNLGLGRTFVFHFVAPERNILRLAEHLNTAELPMEVGPDHRPLVFAHAFPINGIKNAPSSRRRDDGVAE